jgi:hypothetical protein
MANVGSILSTLLTSIANSTNPTQAANVIGNHMTQQNNMTTSVKALISLATPENAAQTATSIAAIPGVPSTITVLLEELGTAKDQATINAVGLQIEAALSANTSSLASILASL